MHFCVKKTWGRVNDAGSFIFLEKSQRVSESWSSDTLMIGNKKKTEKLNPVQVENRQYLFSLHILTAFFMHRKTLWQVEVFIRSAFWSVITEPDSDIEVCVGLDHWSSGWHWVTSHSLSINCIFTDKNKITWHFPALLVAFSSETKIHRSVEI